MPSIVATPVPDQGYTQIVIDWADTPEVDRALIERYPSSYDANFFVAPRVRSESPVALDDPNLPYTRLSHGWAIFYDYEAPLGQPVTYTTRAPNSLLTASTALVTLQEVSGVGWLKDPLRPGNNLRLATDEKSLSFCYEDARGIFLVGLAGRRYKADSAHFEIPGSVLGATAYSVRKGYTNSLRIATRADVDRQAMLALLAPGAPLLLQLPAKYNEADQYLDVGEVAEERVHGDHARQWRAFTLPFIQIPAPDSAAQGRPGTRWRDLCLNASTWTALKATGATYRDAAGGGSDRYTRSAPSVARSTTPFQVVP